MSPVSANNASRRANLGNLEQRVANQHTRINQGERSGNLTKTEAAGLRGKLDKAQSSFQNDSFDGNGLSRGADADKMLRGIGKDIKGAKGNGDIDPAQKMNNIDRRIENGIKNGSLTAEEGEAMKAKAAEARKTLESAKTPEEKKAAVAALKGLSKEVFKEKHDGEMDAAKRTENFNNRIKAGLADGSLTQDEATKLSERTKSMTPDAKTVNELNRDIFKARHNQTTDTEARTKAVTAKIDTMAKEGKLTPDQVSAFKAQLEQLKGDAQAVGPRLNVLMEQLNGLNQAAPATPVAAAA